jgi:peptide/nickel transport system substrate-binding protein
MQFIRRRYYFWLIKAYFKRWSKTIITSAVLGAIIFFVLVLIFNLNILPRLQNKLQKVGYAGSYTLETLPREILSDVSYGITKTDESHVIKPGAAYKWQIKNDGKEYLIHIKKGQYYHDNSELTAKNLPIAFKDVEKKIIDDYTVSFRLKNPYAPFLATLSAPVLNKNMAGLGEYKLKDVDLNAGFIRSMTLVKRGDSSSRKIIYFYPNEEALRIAYALGEIDIAKGLRTTSIKDHSLLTFSNTKITRSVNYNRLVAAFYNNSDKILSNKKIRQALNYALPAKFQEGERAFSPIPPVSLYFSKPPNYGIVDPGISKALLSGETEVKNTVLEISVLEGYENVANAVVNAWEKVGVRSKIKVVESLPQSFQILIYPMNLPQDPDQYALWHSGEVNNISRYKNLRIDKILEDGRFNHDRASRIELYHDFQKYLIDDVPASFLYFPYEYEASRN